MNDRDQESPTPKGPEVPADPIGTLLRISGRRPSISPQRSARAREAVRAHWEAQVEQGARRRRFWMRMALTTAATAVVAIGVGIWRQGTLSSIGRAVGQVEVVSSSAWSRSTSLLSTRAQASLQPGDEVTAGSELATGREGRAAIRLESGHSVRLDTETRLRILSDRTLALERGAVYVDSRNSLGPPDGAVEIRTSLGVVRDLGTQFEVRLTDASLRVKVREGEVSLDGRDQPLQVTAGHELTVGEAGGPSVRELAAFGSEWEWLDQVTPLMDLQGRSLQEFLEWMSRERGLRLEFETPTLADTSSRTLLKGSVDGMTLDQALESVLATCGMRYRVAEGSMIIVRPDPAP